LFKPRQPIFLPCFHYILILPLTTIYTQFISHKWTGAVNKSGLKHNVFIPVCMFPRLFCYGEIGHIIK